MNVTLSLLALFSLLIAILPSSAQNNCIPKTRPPEFQGGKSNRFSLSFFSDADDADGKKMRWCYERVIFNGDPERQIWVHWKDSFGDIMNILIGPKSRHAVYQRNLEGTPVDLPGIITYGDWQGIKVDDLPAKVWRSPQEAQRQAAQEPLPIISGYEVMPFLADKKQGVPIRVELRSEFQRKNKRLIYVIANLKWSTPFWIPWGPPMPAQIRYPSVEWPVSKLKPVQQWLWNKQVEVIDSGAELSIVLEGIPDAIVRTGPITIKLGDKIIFNGTASAYMPAE